MNGRARLWASKPQPNDLMLVLHRPLEAALQISGDQFRSALRQFQTSLGWGSGNFERCHKMPSAIDQGHRVRRIFM